MTFRQSSYVATLCRFRYIAIEKLVENF